MPRVLSIDVPMALLEDWVGWFAPDPQPFVVDAVLASVIGTPVSGAPLTPELRDTFGLYPSQSGSALAWWGEREFRALPRPHRAALVRAQRALGREVVSSVRSWEPLLGNGLRGQADGYRFVWWRSLLRGHEQQVLTDFVEDGRRPSRHEEVPAEVWTAAVAVLPAAPRLAGTFPPSSGPNCFGTVMGAAGVPRAETEWMQREPFERWLTERTRPGGSDDDAGTVLVWRSPDGLLYRRRWGWLLGHRFLLLTHQGRRTGPPRCTVLEVVRWDPAGPSATVVAGLGYQADWLRNLTANGVAHIDTGRHSFDAACRRLTVGEAVDVLVDYELATGGSVRSWGPR